eukprot:190945-Chlamydomonas_euryale.AAC.10
MPHLQAVNNWKCWPGWIPWGGPRPAAPVGPTAAPVGPTAAPVGPTASRAHHGDAGADRPDKPRTHGCRAHVTPSVVGHHVTAAQACLQPTAAMSDLPSAARLLPLFHALYKINMHILHAPESGSESELHAPGMPFCVFSQDALCVDSGSVLWTAQVPMGRFGIVFMHARVCLDNWRVRCTCMCVHQPSDLGFWPLEQTLGAVTHLRALGWCTRQHVGLPPPFLVCSPAIACRMQCSYWMAKAPVEIGVVTCKIAT